MGQNACTCNERDFDKKSEPSQPGELALPPEPNLQSTQVGPEKSTGIRTSDLQCTGKQQEQQQQSPANNFAQRNRQQHSSALVTTIPLGSIGTGKQTLFVGGRMKCAPSPNSGAESARYASSRLMMRFCRSQNLEFDALVSDELASDESPNIYSKGIRDCPLRPSVTSFRARPPGRENEAIEECLEEEHESAADLKGLGPLSDPVSQPINDRAGAGAKQIFEPKPRLTHDELILQSILKIQRQ